MPSSKLNLGLTRSEEEIRARFSRLQTREDVSELLEVGDEYLRIILYARREPSSYHKFEIPKRSGGTRQISVPPSALHILQKKLNKVLQLAYHDRPSVHGFVPGRSTLTNAEPHVGRPWVLNVDLRDFFPSINFGRVRGMFMAPPYGVPAAAATVLAQICTADNELPQGAPTSPVVSNMICGRLDSVLRSLARRHGCAYTRFADDLSFSCDRQSFPEALASKDGGWVGSAVSIGRMLGAAIEDNGFEVHPNKTRLQSCDCHQEVTGITVNKRPNVPRAFVREIRAIIHAWEKYGLAKTEKVFRERYAKGGRRPGAEPPSLRRFLKGKLDYLQMVRGSRDYIYCRYRERLHKLDGTLIGPAPVPAPRTPPAGVLSWDFWHREYLDRVFQLEVKKANGDVGSGTAFVLAPGTLVTAAHVLCGEVSVQTGGGPIEVASASPHPLHASTRDCAVFSVASLRAAIPHDDRIPRPGEEIVVLGFPTVPQRLPALGVYRGRVESINSDYGETTQYIQVDVEAGGGLSGAPVISRDGFVIGIMVEELFEGTDGGVPRRGFPAALPIRHAGEIDVAATLTPLPIPGWDRHNVSVRVADAEDARLD